MDRPKNDQLQSSGLRVSARRFSPVSEAEVVDSTDGTGEENSQQVGASGPGPGSVRFKRLRKLT